jgi:Sec-independent protein translocase protein TatA
MLNPLLAFLAPGGGEMLVVLLALLLLFGPKEAPRMLRKVLDFLRSAQQTTTRFKNDLLSADLRANPPTPSPPDDASVYNQERKPTPPPPPAGPPPP